MRLTFLDRRYRGGVKIIVARLEWGILAWMAVFSLWKKNMYLKLRILCYGVTRLAQGIMVGATGDPYQEEIKESSGP